VLTQITIVNDTLDRAGQGFRVSYWDDDTVLSITHDGAAVRCRDNWKGTGKSLEMRQREAIGQCRKDKYICCKKLALDRRARNLSDVGWTFEKRLGPLCVRDGTDDANLARNVAFAEQTGGGSKVMTSFEKPDGPYK